MDPSFWQAVAQRRKNEVNSAIPEAYHISEALLDDSNFINLPDNCGLLNERELEITSNTANGLLKLLHSETYTAVEVTTAFCQRAAIAHQAVSVPTCYPSLR
jgi:amidase